MTLVLDYIRSRSNARLTFILSLEHHLLDDALILFPCRALLLSA